MRRLLLTLVLLLPVQMPAAAGEPASAWQIVQSAGEVSVRRGGFMLVALDPKAALPEGAIVETGASGRVVLRRGAEQITLDPMSRVVLCDDSDLITRIRQESGTVLFQIGKRRAPHFEVDTPYLAAVVKGTVFRVAVAGDAADVEVSEGAVEVATRSRSAVTLVKPGMTALVRSDGDDEIELLKNGRVTRTISGDDGGWGGPSTPNGGGELLRASGSAADGSGGEQLLTSAPFGAHILRPAIADQPAQSQFGLMRGVLPASSSTKASSAQLDGAGHAVSTAADAAVANTGRAATAVRQAARPQFSKAKAGFPLREIGLCFLALIAYMLTRRFLRLLRSAKERG